MRKKNSDKRQINIFYRIGVCTGIFLAHTAVCFLNLLGYKKTLALAEKAGDFLYLLSRRIKSRVIHNLRFALGDTLSPEAREHTARKVLQNLAKNWFEIAFYGGSSKKIVEENVFIEGKENLDSALAMGKGVIAVSAHLSNYPMLAQQFSRKGYNFVMVIRDPKSAMVSSLYTWSRERIDLHSIYTTPERQFYKNALKVLNSNGILGLISDENKRHGGIFVDFFGHPASTAPGPAALALRTGAPIIPIFMLRGADNSQRVVVEKEITWEAAGDTESQIKEITAKFTRVIEDYIRRDLSQWMWTNFRWRTQPWGRSDEAKLKKKKPLKKLKKLIKQ